ncbi:MAG: hypothetical protein DRI90_13130 [Deltaproteobacteria bacterium]|nr:MAG: hypothetical protein DRI90_13130 [Deltaproteobacteria bacterium]
MRQLRNTLERAAILAEGNELGGELLAMATGIGPSIALVDQGLLTMEAAERQAIERALAHYDGNRRQAAEHLGIGLRTLYDKLKRHQIG